MNIDKSIFRWDGYSDQPATLDKRVKWRLRLRWRAVVDVMKKMSTAFFLIRPVLKTCLKKRTFRPYLNQDGIGLCVNLERPLEDKKILSGSEIARIIRPLNLRRIAIRIPLSDIDNLQEYVDFIGHFPKYRILVVILQNRRIMEDKKELEISLERIFDSLSDAVDCYQIGNVVNRLKWGFLSHDEWFEFFRVAWNLRNRKFPRIKLLGGANIDFELLDHCRSLHNGFSVKYDGYASLLYVDRRGAPESRQMGFNLENKIELLYWLMKDSDKLERRDARLWITEVNWPLIDTGRYSPALDHGRVEEREQLFFLVRYYLLMLATGSVAACYWHQLIAPGYGLIDNRGGVVRKRPAFHGFATVCRLFNGAKIEQFSRQDDLGYYRLVARRDGDEILALWCCGREAAIPMPTGKQAVDIEGRPMMAAPGQPVVISDSVIYLIDG